MHNISIIERFSENINWNAFSYITSKFLATALSFILYKTLSTADFSMWANAHSLIFLSILWLDGGFRKSIPRFIPKYAEHHSFYIQFIKNTALFRIVTLLCALPFFYAVSYAGLTRIQSLSPSSTPPPVSHLLVIICCIFLVEGITSLLRILFHAHFWSKQFNSIYTIMVIVEMSMNYVFVCTITHSSQLIYAILLSKLATGLATASCTAYRFYHAALTKEVNNATPIPDTLKNSALTKQFVTHSTLMWVSNSIKSLSERNCMLPLLTYTLGPGPANMYKVANDGALLFYRSVFKTIGSADTALLSHIQEGENQHVTRRLFFEKISKTIIFLCAVSLTIGVFLSHCATTYAIKPSLLHIFGLLLLSYVLEIILSPYERILEVDQQYTYLFHAYMPYFLIMVSILATPLACYLGLMNTIALVCAARLTGSLITTFYASRNHNTFQFPFGYAQKIVIVCALSTTAIHITTPYLVKYVKLLL